MTKSGLEGDRLRHASSIDPDQPEDAALTAARNDGERPIRRARKVCRSCRGVAFDALRDLCWIAARDERLGIERDGIERWTTGQNQMAALGIPCECGAAPHHAPFAGRKQDRLDRRIVIVVGARYRADGEDDGLAAREDLGPTVRPLVRGERRHRPCHAAVGRHRDERIGRAAGKDQRVIVLPGDPAHVGGMGESERRAFEGDLLDLAVREECDPATIRRERRALAAFGPGQRSSLHRIAGAKVKTRRAVGYGDKHEHRPVW